MRMHPRDALMLLADRPNVTNNFVLGYTFHADAGAEFDLDDDGIERWLIERLEALPDLRNIAVRVPLDLADPTYAVDPAFSYARHIRFHDVDTWDDLRRLAPVLVQEPTDPAHPRWEIHVARRVTGVAGRSDAATVIMVKMHHSLADGVEAVRIAQALFAERPPMATSGPLPVSTPSRRAEVARSVLLFPLAFARFLGSLTGVVGGRRIVADELARGDYTLPVLERSTLPFVGVLGPDREFQSVALPLSELKAVRAAVGNVTLNDVFLTVVSLGLSRHLQEHGIEPDHSLATSMPISVRSIESPAKNQFTVCAVVLHTNEDDPVERMHRIHASAANSIKAGTSVGNRRIGTVLATVPGFVFRGVLQVLKRVQNANQAFPLQTSVSNVFMGPGDWKLGNARGTSGFAVVTLEAFLGLAHVVDTLADTATINVTCDPNLFPDSDRYRVHLIEAWEELRRAAGIADYSSVVGGSLTSTSSAGRASAISTMRSA